VTTRYERSYEQGISAYLPERSRLIIFVKLCEFYDKEQNADNGEDTDKTKQENGEIDISIDDASDEFFDFE